MESAVSDEKSENLTENDEEKIEAPLSETLEPENSTLGVPEPEPQHLGTLEPENQQLENLQSENQESGTLELENPYLENLQPENKNLGTLEPGNKYLGNLQSENPPLKVLRSKKSRWGILEVENEPLGSPNQLSETKPQNLKSENEPLETLGAENKPFEALKFEIRPPNSQYEPLDSTQPENLPLEVLKSENESLSSLGVNNQPFEDPKFALGSPKLENHPLENLESQNKPSEVPKSEIQTDEPSEKENDLMLLDPPKTVEQNPKTLLDKEKIKKRLQAFSLMKQGLTLSPIKKFGTKNKTVTQFSGEVQYDENGEKLNEKIVIKKPSKKGQKSHDEIAKSTIDEIEELKKVEKHFYSNPFITPGIPIKSVALDSDQNLDREWERDRKRERERDKDYNRSPRRSKKSQKHRDHKEKPRKHRNSDSFEIKMPQNWKNCKDEKIDFYQIRKVKEKTIRDRKRDRDKNLSRPTDIFDTPSSLRNFYVVNSSKDDKETKKFPLEIIKFTEKNPKITYCENPQVAKPAFLNRKQLLNIVPKERIEILKAFLNNKIRHLEPVAVITSARNWFPKEKYLTESELVYEKPEISYGLSVLTQSYFDEMDYEIQETKVDQEEKIDSENTENSDKGDKETEISNKIDKNDKNLVINDPELDLEHESLTPKIKPMSKSSDRRSENGSCDSTPDTNDYRSNWESDEDLIDEILAENQFGTPPKSPKISKSTESDKKPSEKENKTSLSNKDVKIDQKSIDLNEKIEKNPILADNYKKMEIRSPKSTHQKSDLKSSQSLEKFIKSPEKSTKSEKIEGKSLNESEKNRNRSSSPNFDREEKSRSRRDSTGAKNHRNRSKTPEKPLRHRNRSKSPKNRSRSPKKQRGSPNKSQESNKNRSEKSWSPKRSENRSKSPKNRSRSPKNRETPRKRPESHENRGFPKNRAERHENSSKGSKDTTRSKSRDHRSKSREKYSTKENREKLSTSRESLSKSRKNRSKSDERSSYDRKRSKSHDLDKKRSKSREKIDRPRSKVEKLDRTSQNREKTPKKEKRGRKDSECSTEVSKPSKREKYLLEHFKPGDISFKRENLIDTNEISTNFLTNRESKTQENLTDKLDRIIRSKEKSSWSSDDDDDFSSKPKISEHTDDSENSSRKKSKKHTSKKLIKNQVIIDYNDYEKYIDDSIIVEEKSQPVRHKIKIDYSDFEAVLEKPMPKVEKDNFSDSHTPEIYSDNTNFTPDRLKKEENNFRSHIFFQIEKSESTPQEKFSPLPDKSENSQSLSGESPPLRTKSPPLKDKSLSPRDNTPPLRAVTPPTREGRNKTPPRREDRSTEKLTPRNKKTDDFCKQLTPPLKTQKRQTTPLRELRATPTKGSNLAEVSWAPSEPLEVSLLQQNRPFINFSNEKNLSTGVSFTLGSNLQMGGGDIAPKGGIQLAKPLEVVSPIPAPITDCTLLNVKITTPLMGGEGPIGIEASNLLNRYDTFGGRLATPLAVGEGPHKDLPSMTEPQVGEGKVGSESCDPSKLVSEYEEFMKAVSFDSTEIFDEEQIPKKGKVENEKIEEKKEKGSDDENENQISFKFDKKRKVEKLEKQSKKRRNSKSSSEESSESSSDSSSSNSSDSSDSSSSDSTDSSDSESETSSDSENSDTEPEILTIKQEKLSDTEMDKNVTKNIVIKKEKFDMFEEMQNKLLNDPPVTTEKQIFNLDEIQLPTDNATTEKTPKMFIPTKILTKAKPQKPTPEYQPTEQNSSLNSPALTEITTTTTILNSPKIDLSIRKRPSNLLNISPIKKMLMEDSDSDQDFTDKFKKHNDTLSLKKGTPKEKGGIPTELSKESRGTEIVSKGLEATKEGSKETGEPLGPILNKPLGIYKLSTESDTKDITPIQVPLMQTTRARGGFKEATPLEGVPTNIGIYKLAPIPVQREATAVEEPPKETEIETEAKISEKEKGLLKENIELKEAEDCNAKKDSKRRSEKRDRDSRDREYRSERSRDRKRSSRDRRRSYSRERERSKTSRETRETRDSRDSRKGRDYDRRRSSKRYSRSPTPKRDKKIHRSPPRSKIDSPNSEFLGFKKSLADSTISDSELSIRKNYYDDHLNEGTPYQRLPTPDSPKRISLDDRINQVLGIEKPKPIESVCNRNQPSDYENYHGNYHDNYYHNYHHHDQYNLHYQQGNYQHGYQHHQSYHHELPIQNQNQNHNHQQQQQKTKVLQVGNVIQVVPTENIQNINPAPVIPTANVHEMPPKVVQVGNVLQIVPISTLPAVETKITEPDTSEPPSAEIPEVVSNTPNLVPVPIVEPPIEKTISISEKLILKEKRKHERELRRQEKEKKRLEKQKRKQIKMKLRTENMIKKALLLETTEMQEAEEEEKIELTGESRITSLPWPPTTILNLNKTPSKGILVTPGFSSKQVSLIDGELTTDTKKVVKFADGICPGEGTSPSGGEDLPSPPPPTRKKIKSKKKVKVKIIRTQQPIVAEESDEEDNLPPPPPPPGSPPPHLWPPRVKTAPQIPNQVPIQQMYPNPFPPQTPPGVLGYPPAFTSHHPIRHHMPVMPVHGTPPMGPQHLGPPQFHPHRSHPD